jgi:hypothetical protein
MSGVRKDPVEKESSTSCNARKFEKMYRVRFAPSTLMWSKDAKHFSLPGSRSASVNSQ